MDKIEGRYITLEEVDKGLLITLTPEGDEVMRYEWSEATPSRFTFGEDSFTEHNQFAYWLRSKDGMWGDLMEDIQSNSDWALVNPEDVGGLTDSPLIGSDCQYDDNGDLMHVKHVYWFPNYMVEDELKTLIHQGHVTFTKAEED